MHAMERFYRLVLELIKLPMLRVHLKMCLLPYIISLPSQRGVHMHVVLSAHCHRRVETAGTHHSCLLLLKLKVLVLLKLKLLLHHAAHINSNWL